MKNKSLNFKPKKILKKAVSFITAVVMAAMLIPSQPVTAFAADAHSHPVCGAVHSDIGDHTGSCADIEWTELTDSTAMPSEAGSYYLTADITLTQTWTIPENTAVNLCLNGHSISGDNSVQVIHISKGATLSLCDCSTAGTGKITNGLAKQNAEGSLYNAGGGICVNKGTLNIYGGSITGNRTNYFQAGGVNVYGGTLSMYGGTISGNTASGSGGGVCIQDYIGTQPSEFNMYGGTILGNTAEGSGGGVYIIGSIFNMHGGTISDNTAEASGGGVWLQSFSSTISGGTISGNKAEKGSGIFLTSNSTLYLSGSPVIENNTRNGSSGENYELYKNYNVAATDNILDNVIITAPLTDGAVIPSANYKTGDIVAKGTDSYTVTASDMAKFGIPADAAYQKVLDSANNRIVLGHSLADGGMASLEYNVIQYDGISHKPLVLVTYNDQPLAENIHYTVTWPDDTTNAGDKTVTVQGIFGANDSYYVGKLQSTYIITPKQVTPVINGINDSYSYTGSQIKPQLTVKDGENILTEDTDYTVIYGSNTAVNDGGTVKVEMKGNYSGSSEKTFAITKATPDLTNVTAVIPDNENDTGKIVFSGAAVGQTEAAGNYTVTAPDVLVWGENTVRFTFTPADLENCTEATGTVTVTVKDTVAPTGMVTMAENSRTEFSDNIAFDRYLKETVDVKVTATDNLSGIKSVEYIESSEALTIDALKQKDSWSKLGTDNRISVTAEDAKQFVYYIRITDNADNVIYLSTDGAIFDTQLPVISGITDGATYYTTQKFTVTDANSDTVTVNGSAVTEENYTLAGNTDREYKIIATDKAGNSTTVTVKMKTIASISESISGLDTENATSDNSASIKTAENALTAVDTTNATQSEKDEITAAQTKISTLQKAIAEKSMDKAEQAISNIAEGTDLSDDEETVTAVINAIESYNNLSEQEKTALGSDFKDRLDKAVDAVTKYEIIHGADSNWTQGSASTLGFTANGVFSLFKEVRIADAQGIRTTLVRDAEYTAQSGSTIVTLKQSYLDTLAVGQYTLEIVFDIIGAEHIADCSFTVKAKPAPAHTATPEPTPTPAATKKPAQKVTAKPTATPEATEEPVEEKETETGTTTETETGDGQQQDETEAATPQLPVKSVSIPILPIIIALAAVVAVMIIIILKKKKEDEE